MGEASLLDHIIPFVDVLFELQRLLLQPQEAVLQLLPGHTRDVLPRPGVLIGRRLCEQKSTH